MPAEIELLAVQYPGRQERRADPAATDIAAMAGEVARGLLAFADRPLALFGHSMGALVAFETTCLIQQRDTVLRLFASAARPPSQQWDVADLDASDESIITGLRRLGGVPELLLTDADTRCELLRVLRDDNAMMHRYPGRQDAVIAAPVTVLVGDVDPKNNADEARGWARHTSAELNIEVFPGGHFYLSDQLPFVASVLIRRVKQDLAALSSQHEEDTQ
jgi:surfactin synthase thioesterase subunit